MDNKDFFDEEYSKMVSKQSTSSSDNSSDWYTHQPAQSKQNSNKPLYITLICFALVLCIVFGWMLCTIFSGIKSDEEKLLGEVLSVLNSEYYKKVDDASMWEGIEDAGTALLRTAGDRFSMLLSPASHYSLRNPQSTIGDDKDVFGMTFQIIEGIGLYVSSVATNSNCYGVLESGDIIVKISNINNNKGVTIDKVNYTEVLLNQVTSELGQLILLATDSADFSVMRDGEIFTKYLARGKLSYVNSQYPFEFVEFYFGDDCTNVSLTHGSTGPQTSIKEQRLLDRLSLIPNAGYVRIDQFMDTMTDTGETTASGEFAKVMNLFVQRGLKYLILDLKGNPGGDVQYVSEIAGMLVTDSGFSAAQQQKLRDRENKLLITTLETRSKGNYSYTAESKYEQYFGALTDKQKIVVWTDGGSASASELLTGALRDYGTAVQMGTTTYGKGIAQTIKELTNYQGTFKVDGEEITYCWAVYYTVAEYFSPVTHTNIHGIGYTPDEPYNNLNTYDKLWDATEKYFKSMSSGTLA